MKKYEITISRSEEKVPVIDGIHLHSAYNPTKEAIAFAERYRTQLTTKKNVLILGLGFAYHVNEIAKILSSKFDEDYSIVVIEPNENIFQGCLNEHLLNLKNVIIYSGAEPENYYTKKELTRFLLGRPTVIAHPASFNFNQRFFKSFLAYESPRTIGEMLTNFNEGEVKNYLARFSSELNIDQASELTFNQNSNLGDLDFLLLALKAMTPTSSKEKNANGDM